MENNTKEKLIKDAQYRKGLSIAFFNATNAAIELVKSKQIGDREEELKLVIKVRDFFLEEHTKYYAETIAKVGVNYDVKETLKKVKVAKNLTELKNVWIALSEDERQDEQIIKAVKQEKSKHEKA